MTGQLASRVSYADANDRALHGAIGTAATGWSRRWPNIVFIDVQQSVAGTTWPSMAELRTDPAVCEQKTCVNTNLRAVCSGGTTSGRSLPDVDESKEARRALEESGTARDAQEAAGT